MQTRVLFDVDSQKSYCILSAKDALNLPTLKRNGSWSKPSVKLTPGYVSVIQFNWEFKVYKGMSLYVNVFAVGRICSPLSNQTIELTQRQLFPSTKPTASW